MLLWKTVVFIAWLMIVKVYNNQPNKQTQQQANDNFSEQTNLTKAQQNIAFKF